MLFWSLWGQRFGEYRADPDEGWSVDGLLYRKEESPAEGWRSCGFVRGTEIFYSDPYLEDAS